MQPLFLSCISNLQDADSNTTSGLGPDNRNSGDEMVLGFPGGSAGKESACNVGDLGLFPGLGRSLGREWLPTTSILAWRIPRTV